MTNFVGTNGNPLTTSYDAVTNNALLDPLQGFDADVWVIDQATGAQALVGRFTSIQITIRNATEPYMEFNQRVPRYLDGEVQIGWVMERGQLDTRILQQTFGLSALTREARLNRMARFQITFELNAADLQRSNPSYNSGSSILGNGELVLPTNGRDNQRPDLTGQFANRKAQGQLMLTFCRVDSFTLGATAGRSVIANRWEGLAEGIEEVDRAVTWAGVGLNSVAADRALRDRNVRQGTEIGRPRGSSNPILNFFANYGR